MYVIGHYESDMLSEIRQDFGHHVWCFPGQTVSDMLWDTEPDLGVSGNSHPQSSGLAMAGEQPTGAAPGPYLARVTPTGAASAIASAREATSTPPGRAHLSAVPGKGCKLPPAQRVSAPRYPSPTHPVAPDAALLAGKAAHELAEPGSPGSGCLPLSRAWVRFGFLLPLPAALPSPPLTGGWVSAPALPPTSDLRRPAPPPVPCWVGCCVVASNPINL
jgi:hypothetical protein